MGRFFIMKKKNNYVECQGCKWQIEQNIVPNRDWAKNPCPKCNNTRQVTDPREILCNLCGECMCPIGTMNEQYPHGLHNAKVVGGYDSYHLLDMNRYTFSFCEKCLRQLFIQCKIKPEVDEVDFSGGSTEDSWESDQSSYEYRVWVDSGALHQSYLDKKCNVKKDCPNKAAYTRMINNHFSEECTCEEHKGTDGGSYKYVKFIPNVLKPFL